MNANFVLELGLPDCYGEYLFLFKDGKIKSGYYCHPDGFSNPIVEIIGDSESSIISKNESDIQGYLAIVTRSATSPERKSTGISIKERGWKGHLCVAEKCQFSRNTLIENSETSNRVVISTIGNYKIQGTTETIGLESYYETKIFEAYFDGTYWDARTNRQIYIDTEVHIREVTHKSDLLANQQHEKIVKEISKLMESKFLKSDLGDEDE